MNYTAARAQAQSEANRFNRPMGIERAREFGREVFRVKMIPKNPAQRFGWETRCEVVEPE
jgi:hypothetical protein